jgi:hypothetical protein
MKISKWEFEKELDALINAALSASNKETARRFLLEADNKIDGYDNIPGDLQREYRRKIQAAERKLGL